MAYASTKSNAGNQTVYVDFAFLGNQTTGTPTIGSIITTLGSGGFALYPIPSTLVWHVQDATVATDLTGLSNGVNFKWDFNIDQQNQNINGNTAVEIAAATSRVNPFARVALTILPTQQLYVYAYPVTTVGATPPSAADMELQLSVDVEPYASFKSRMGGGLKKG